MNGSTSLRYCTWHVKNIWRYISLAAVGDGREAFRSRFLVPQKGYRPTPPPPPPAPSHVHTSVCARRGALTRSREPVRRIRRFISIRSVCWNEKTKNSLLLAVFSSFSRVTLDRLSQPLALAKTSECDANAFNCGGLLGEERCQRSSALFAICLLG